MDNVIIDEIARWKEVFRKTKTDPPSTEDQNKQAAWNQVLYQIKHSGILKHDILGILQEGPE